MCLFSKTQTPLIASKDIVVYKVLDRITNNLYLTPYKKYPIKFKWFCKNILLPKEELGVNCLGWSYMVTTGYHAYQCESRAKIDLVIHDTYTIAKAVIPKGTKYLLGDADIVAEQIIIFKP